MNQGKDWDKVSKLFDTYKEDVWYGAADNIATLWPPVLKFIKENFTSPVKNLRALEFGCGTGMFAMELKKFGFETVGIDVSEEMIKIGKENLKNEVELKVGDTKTANESAKQNGKFNLITALMVLQFIDDNGVKELVESLADESFLIFGNHNPENLKQRGFTNTFTLSSGDITVPIYIRQPEDYDKLFESFGLKRILTSYPEADEQFLKQNNLTRPADVPKYMLLAYKKTI